MLGNPGANRVDERVYAELGKVLISID